MRLTNTDRRLAIIGNSASMFELISGIIGIKRVLFRAAKVPFSGTVWERRGLDRCILSINIIN